MTREEANYEHLLRNLLAVIHRDGGHYAARHGIEKACADAQKKVIDWLAKSEADWLGTCHTPHHLHAVSPDRKSLIQSLHPEENSCKDWQVDPELKVKR